VRRVESFTTQERSELSGLRALGRKLKHPEFEAGGKASTRPGR
jgi:hypothetical protein